jgi:hypothetical protein
MGWHVHPVVGGRASVCAWCSIQLLQQWEWACKQLWLGCGRALAAILRGCRLQRWHAHLTPTTRRSSIGPGGEGTAVGPSLVHWCRASQCKL